jgi:hypothetical protein
MSTRTITLPADQWEAILEAVQDRWDEGPPGEGWQGSRLSAASAALSTALAQPEPEALTVQECNDMRKHRENYIYECSDGDIQLDGCFSREDLLELARTIPANQQPPES